MPTGKNQVLFKTDGYHLLLQTSSTGAALNLRPRGNQTTGPTVTGLTVLFDTVYHVIIEADYSDPSSTSMIWTLYNLEASTSATASTVGMEVFKVLQTTHYGYIEKEPENTSNNLNMPDCGSAILVPSKSTATKNALVAYQEAIYAGTNTIPAVTSTAADFFLELEIKQS